MGLLATIQSSPDLKRLKREQLHLPVHPSLDRPDLDHMVEAVRSSLLKIQ